MRVALVVFVALRSLTIVTESAREVCCCYTALREMFLSRHFYFLSASTLKIL